MRADLLAALTERASAGTLTTTLSIKLQALIVFINISICSALASCAEQGRRAAASALLFALMTVDPIAEIQ